MQVWQRIPSRTAASRLLSAGSYTLQIFLPNFEFEEQLSGRGNQLPQGARAVLRSLSPLLGLLANPGDQVVCEADAIPETLPAVFPQVSFLRPDQLSESLEHGRLVPWGWDRIARQLQENFEGTMAPEPDAVFHVNSRRFLAEFDRVLTAETEGGGPPGGTLCESVAAVKAALIRQTGDGSWWIKPNISGAGRNIQRVTGQSLSSPQTGWLNRQLNQHGVVYVEPAYQVISEWGLQYEVPPSGNVPVFLGAAELLTDQRGQYLGSCIGTPIFPGLQTAIDHGRQVAKAAAAAGYWGPLGIDAMQIAGSDGQRLWRFCHDINGRLTMGRLAISLQRLLKPGQSGLFYLRSRTDQADPGGSPGKFPASVYDHAVDTVNLTPEYSHPGRPAVQAALVVMNDPTATRHSGQESSC